MDTLARRPSIAEIRRATAVGWPIGVELGLDRVPGVVLADIMIASPGCPAWMPQGHVSIRVWGGDGPRVWLAIQDSIRLVAPGLQPALEVYPATRWARVRAWWRWTLHRLEQALEGKR